VISQLRYFIGVRIDVGSLIPEPLMVVLDYFINNKERVNSCLQNRLTVWREWVAAATGEFKVKVGWVLVDRRVNYDE